MANVYEVLDEVRIKKNGPYHIVFQKIRDMRNDDEGYMFTWTDKDGEVNRKMAAFLGKEDLLELMRKAQGKGWFPKHL